jgi:hypothetical protein
MLGIWLRQGLSRASPWLADAEDINAKGREIESEDLALVMKIPAQTHLAEATLDW